MSERNPDSGQRAPTDLDDYATRTAMLYDGSSHAIQLAGVELWRPVRTYTSLHHAYHGALELHSSFVLWRVPANLPIIIPLGNVSHCYPLTMAELPRARG